MTALDSQPIATADPEEQRRLAAIVFTDVVGYSRLAEQDEQKTLALVRRDLKIITDTCESLGGAAMKNTGDGLLMCFSSAEAAVSCALRVQKAFTDAPKTLPPDEVLQHRIGIHLGDVFLSSCDVAGKDVNIANRLLGQAEPNGICISQTVYDVVKSKTGLKATYLGPVELKNIREHIPVYKLLLLAGGERDGRAGDSVGLDAVSAASLVDQLQATRGRRRRRTMILTVGAALAVVIAAVPMMMRAKGRASSVPAPSQVDGSRLVPPPKWQDLLPLARPDMDSIRGPWQAVGGELSIDASDNNNILPFPVVPRGDYQLELSVTRLRGDSDVVVYLPAPTRDASTPAAQVTLHLGYMKDKDLLTGSVHAPSALAGRNGQPFKVLATVKSVEDDVHVVVDLNGKRHLRAQMPLDNMAPFAPAWGTPARERLGLGADDVHVRFHSFRIRMLNGHLEQVK